MFCLPGESTAIHDCISIARENRSAALDDL